MLTGHPKGLFRLFLIEMWERLAFYTMVGILLLYTLDRESGGLGMPKAVGNEIYGLYLAFVYFTPYLGGLIADRFLGYRKAVLLGGVFFAGGFFLMAAGMEWSFVAGLVCLCIGNGFFKPNISAMVGNLYQPGDPKRDEGFNIFYMGINIGALIGPFLAAVTRNVWYWEATFVAAGLGMVASVVILLANWRVLESADRTPGRHPDDTPFAEILLKILGPAAVVGILGYFAADAWMPASLKAIGVRPSDVGFLIGAVPIIVFFATLHRKGNAQEKPGLLALLPVYVAGGTFFMVLHLNGSAMTTWAKENTDREAYAVLADNWPLSLFVGDAYPRYYANAEPSTPRPDQRTLLPVATAEQATMFGQKRMGRAALQALQQQLPADVRVVEIPRDQRSEQQRRWNNFAVDVYEQVAVKETRGAHGEREITVEVDDAAPVLQRVAFVRTVDEQQFAVYLVTPERFAKVYAGAPPQLPPGQLLPTANPELYQSFNPLYVLLFTPLVVAFFAWLRRRGRPFSTARKIFVGMLLTSLSAVFMSLAGAVSGDGAVKVSGWWLGGFYAIVTLGELFLSPMALSLVTKLSPKRLVGLTMGGWFFATAVGNKFSGFLGGLQGAMPPTGFFLVIAGACALVALFILVVLPRLDRAIRQYGA